jgi:GntR family transcriptional regulator
LSVVRGVPFYAQVADALREDIRSGRYPPGVQLPSERELRERFSVSSGTVRAAIVQLRAEGLITSRQGRGVFVAEQPVARRLSTDIAAGSDAYYSMLKRHGLRPATTTTVRRGPCPPDAADALGVEEGSEVVIRERLVRAEGRPPDMLATSYFPTWVVEAAPNLENPTMPGLPRWLHEAFGPTYSEDTITARTPTAVEQERLEMSAGTPVLIVKSTERDSQHRPVHFKSTVAAAGRIEFSYRYGAVPDEADESETT